MIFDLLAASGKSRKLTLFYKGNQHEKITGGWADNVYMLQSDYSRANATIGNTIKFSVKEARTYVAVSPKKTIDLTNYSKLCIKFDHISYWKRNDDPRSDVCTHVVIDRNNTMDDSTYVSLTKYRSGGTYTIDISNLTSNYYLAIGSANFSKVPDTESVSTTISKIWLEK